MKTARIGCCMSFVILMLAAALVANPAQAEQPTVEQARAAMKQAATFYRGKLAVQGGYVYYYSPDLQRRLGEGVATPTQVWVQPPGTPTVGLAFAAAYRATGDRFYLEAARAAAEALMYGQLRSGGWTNCIDFDPRGTRVAAYRNGRGRGKDNSTLDDGISQSAIQCLVAVDEITGFKDEALHKATEEALDALLAAQFEHGGFPQVWTGPVPKQVAAKANYPDYDWRTEGRIKNYWDQPTLNDGLAGTVAETLIAAHRTYKDPRFLNALKQLGQFLVQAQMPMPQPAWAQQYNPQMQPIWARRFEPAAIAGRESQDVMLTLLKIYDHTGDRAYLQPIPDGVAYLKKSLLPNGQLSRYYELKSNRPLYMSRKGRDYTLTYDDSQLPSHYGWKVTSQLPEIERRYAAALQGKPAFPSGPSAMLPAEAAAAIAALDDQGRWITRFSGEPLVGQPKFADGEAYISSKVFSENLETLSQFVAQQGK